MNKGIFLLFLLCLSLSPGLVGQHHFPDPDSILVGSDRFPKVLLVGSFHFGYPNLDAHKTAEEDQVDILSPKKQREVEELVDYIARFQPTKICVEGGRNSGYILRRYERWMAGGELKRNEIDQIAFRLMKRFNLDTLYGTDAASLVHEMENSKDSTFFRTYLSELFKGYDWKSDDPMDARYVAFYDHDDVLSRERPLLDYFKYMNSEKYIRRMHGAYLIGDFKLENYRGVDALATYWYDRNLRIFRNIQQIGAGPDDRILVLFGAGHIPILKQLFESSPEFELVKFGALEQSDNSLGSAND